MHVTRDGREHARPLEEIVIVMPQIVKCPVPVPRVMVQEVVPEADRTIAYEDETLQADAEPVTKEMINETYTLQSVVTTGEAQRFHPGH